MDVLVLGTSNCIISDSFIRHFQNYTGARIENCSIGASSCSVGLYVLEAMKNRKFDFAILDYEINDTGAVGQGLKTVEEIGENIRSIISITRSLGSTPILVVVPSAGTLRNPSQVEKIHVEVCRQEGVFFLDLAELFREMMLKGLVTYETLMRDSAHMSARVTPVVGRLLADAVKVMQAAPGRITEHHTTVYKTRRIAAETVFPAQDMLERRSSIYASRYGRLSAGQVLRLPVSADERLLGLLMNTGSKGANVAFSNGRETVVKQLVIYWDIQRPDWFTAICVDFRQQLSGEGSGIDIRVVGQTDTPTEKTLHQQAFLEGRYGEVEIEGFLLASRTKIEIRSPVLERPGLPLDVTALVGRQRIVSELGSIAGP